MDVTVLNSVLAGLLLLLLTVWAWYVYGRLWLAVIENDAHDAITAIEEVGLRRLPMGYRARIVALGQVQGRSVRVVWRGGVRGAHSQVTVDGQRRRVPLICEPGRLRELVRAPQDGA